MMTLHVVLYQPEIPPNTGNIIRLCGNTGATLHLVGPLGFHLDDARVRRAGLDYQELAQVHHHDSWSAFCEAWPDMTIWPFSSHGTLRHDQAMFKPGHGLLFGPESRGLPADIIEKLGADRCLKLPMARHSRSLNLSNCVAVGLYEAWRQLDFAPLAEC
ncbi:MAG: tRNA (cytidine(34)-2'-O)-methyltransferase [Xanthomonadales bacterium]|nr:tRNA (cytidine(34)-2'-O)-methyltransferase [Xanthomonadales bacterium]